ncbi:MAG TPA: type II toxin-antitoxin system RelE/ParE family toxin [Treponema sp.]|nr:type II toxin-antitoxin system RelE/ParE family toxin [Treponema sp.]
MYTVTITKPAEADLNAIVNYYTMVLKASIAADNLIDIIEEKLLFLATAPFTYEIEHDEYLQRKGIRSVLVKNYFIFYTITEKIKKVTILRILYARRNWLQLFTNEEN